MGGIADAVHAEYGTPGTAVITPLACSLDGQEITVEFTRGSRLADLHGTHTAHELTTCNYGLAADFAYLAATHGLRVSAIDPPGTDTDGGVRAIERVDHPFFLATLYQPQLRSTPDAPHPVFVGLLRAAKLKQH